MGDLLGESSVLIRTNQQVARPYLVIQNNPTEAMSQDGSAFIRFLTYQLSIVVYWTTMALTGNGVSGNDSGETA